MIVCHWMRKVLGKTNKTSPPTLAGSVTFNTKLLKGHVFAEIGSLYVDPINYLSSRFDFGFEFAQIFVFEKLLGIAI
jgi:hypothetical protein